MADVPASKRVAKKPSITLEERNLRSIRAKRRFKALVRTVIANRPWLEEVIGEELGENVKRNVQLLTKKKEKKSLLTIQHKAILNKPAEFRTEAEKLLLYRIIGGLSCFRKYPEHVKMKLAGVTYFCYYGPGRVIVRQNQEAYALYFVVTGEVTVSITTFDPVLNEDVTINVGTMLPGNMFGEVSLLHDIPRTATITSGTACELLCLRRADFDIVLKSSVQAQWDEIKTAMKKFSYFDGWDEVAVRECCILAKKKVYVEDETILGDGFGAENHVHFIIKGNCRMIEHLLLSIRYLDGKKKYKLYNAPPEEEEETWMSNTGPQSASEAQILADPTNELNDDNISRDKSVLLKFALSMDKELSFYEYPRSTQKSLSTLGATLSSVTEKKQGSPTSDELEPAKIKLTQKMSCVDFPPNVETHFMQVCIFSEDACFNLGENMRRRRIVAITEVECMLIPNYWIWQRNKGNLWTRIQQFLDSRIPTTEVVFQQFLESRKWRAYKKSLLDSILPYPPSNLINNVPYSIRIKEDLDFADKLF